MILIENSNSEMDDYNEEVETEIDDSEKELFEKVMKAANKVINFGESVEEESIIEETNENISGVIRQASLFIESSETQGILFNRYKNMPHKIKIFLSIIDNYVNKGNKEGAPEDTEEKLTAELNKLKKDLEMDLNNPDPIDVGKIKSLRSSISLVKSEAEDILSELGKIHKKFKFGSNWIKGILIKPKVYQNGTDEEFQINVNKYMRSVARCMDWAEKYILDIMNLADQDLNLLSVVNKVYVRSIFEYVELTFDDDIDIMNENVDDVFDIDHYLENSFVSGKDNNEDISDEEIEDILNTKLPTDKEDYYPIISIINHFDFKRLLSHKEDLTDAQKSMVGHAKSIYMVTKGDNYSHTLVSFDTSMEHLWHFVGTGMKTCSIHDCIDFEVTDSIYMNVTFVTEEELKIVKKEIKRFTKEQDKTAYDLFQLIGQIFGKTIHKDKRLICSAFVGYLLSMANSKNINRDYSLIRPEDITILPRSFYLAQFKDKYDFDKRKGELDEKIKKILDDNYEEISEYNNQLPKVVLKTQLKEKGKLDKFFDWIVKKIQ